MTPTNLEIDERNRKIMFLIQEHNPTERELHRLMGGRTKITGCEVNQTLRGLDYHQLIRREITNGRYFLTEQGASEISIPPEEISYPFNYQFSLSFMN